MYVRISEPIIVNFLIIKTNIFALNKKCVVIQINVAVVVCL